MLSKIIPSKFPPGFTCLMVLCGFPRLKIFIQLLPSELLVFSSRLKNLSIGTRCCVPHLWRHVLTSTGRGSSLKMRSVSELRYPLSGLREKLRILSLKCLLYTAVCLFVSISSSEQGIIFVSISKLSKFPSFFETAYLSLNVMRWKETIVGCVRVFRFALIGGWYFVGKCLFSLSSFYRISLSFPAKKSRIGFFKKSQELVLLY